jgi:hypothetical protein
MTLASSVITSARYDLRDPDKTEYTDPELLDYMNRSMVQLYAVLGAVKSDWVSTTNVATSLLIATNSVAVPSGFSTVRSVWIGSDEIIKTSVDDIYYKRKYITATGQPDYFAIEGATLIFERTADATYALTIHYNTSSTALVAAGTMPFSDEFNQPIRQAIVLMAKNRNEYSVSGDAAIYDFFMEAVMSKVISRNHTPKRYRINF